jgi:hypothetical protein
MHQFRQSNVRMTNTTSVFFILACVLALCAGTINVQAHAAASQTPFPKHPRFTGSVGTTQYQYYTSQAPTFLYNYHASTHTFTADLQIPTISVSSNGKSFGTVYGATTTYGTTDRYGNIIRATNSFTSLHVTGFGGIASDPVVNAIYTWYPSVDLRKKVEDCPLYGQRHENQFGQVWSFDNCPSRYGALIHGLAYSDELGYGHRYYYSTDPVYAAFGRAAQQAETAMQSLSNGRGFASSAQVANLVPLALTATQKTALYVLITGGVLTVSGNFLKNYCVPIDTECVQQNHWLALLGGILADIGNTVTTGGTLIFGLPAIQDVANAVREANIGNQRGNYFVQHNHFNNPNQIHDIENQIAVANPQLRLRYQ